MKTAIIGANGQLGADLMRTLSSWPLIPLTRRELDVCDPIQVSSVLKALRPDAVINTAAYTRVDECENEVHTAFSVNAYGARNVARVCADLDAVLVHLSTDYVFDGRKSSPYIEEDLPNPLSVYGVSKLAGEYFVRNMCTRHFIVRSSGLYGVAGSSGKGGNFVETMIRMAKEKKTIRVVNDQVLTPTYTKDLAEEIRLLLATQAYGLYHITNSGQCSWFEFAEKIFELLNLTIRVSPINTSEFNAKAQRAAYSVLANSRLQGIGRKRLRSWIDALKTYLSEGGQLRL